MNVLADVGGDCVPGGLFTQSTNHHKYHKKTPSTPCSSDTLITENFTWSIQGFASMAFTSPSVTTCESTLVSL